MFSKLCQIACVVVPEVVEVDHWWIEELVLSYAFPLTWFVAGEFRLVWKHNLVVCIHLDVWLIDAVLEVTSLIRVPLFVVWMSVIWCLIPTVDWLGRIV